MRLSLYTLFALIITFPIILNLDRVVTGSLGTDITRVGIFSVCQTKKALLETHMFSLFADKVNYPIGGYLFYFDPLTSVYEVILSPLFKFPVDYNLIFLLNIVGGALAAYFLVYYLTKNTVAAFIGGVIVGFCPVRFTSYIDGVSEYAHIMWLPLYVLYLYRLYEEKEKTLENVFICGILFFLCFFAGWYFGLYALLLTTALLLYHIFWNPATRNEKAAVIKKTVYAFIVGASLIYPFTLAQFQILSYDERAGMGSGITVKGDARVRSIFARTNSPDVKEFFCRGKGESDNRSFPMHQMVYLGYVSLILAGIGLVTGRRNRNVILWAILGVFFFLVTLGALPYHMGKIPDLMGLSEQKVSRPLRTALRVFSRIQNDQSSLSIRLSCSDVHGGAGRLWRRLYHQVHGRKQKIDDSRTLYRSLCLPGILLPFPHAAPTPFLLHQETSHV